MNYLQNVSDRSVLQVVIVGINLKTCFFSLFLSLAIFRKLRSWMFLKMMMKHGIILERWTTIQVTLYRLFNI